MKGLSRKWSVPPRPAGGSSVTRFTLKPASSALKPRLPQSPVYEVSVAAVANRPEEAWSKMHSTVLEDKTSHSIKIKVRGKDVLEESHVSGFMTLFSTFR